MKDLIIFGASGFGREVAWAVERVNKVSPTWNLLGFLDDYVRSVLGTNPATVAGQYSAGFPISA